MSSFRNVLLVQLGDIGDVVLTTPTVRAIKEIYPGARVSILVFKPYGSLLAADKNLYEVIETARIRGSVFRRLKETLLFARYLRKKHYDLVIDLRTGDRGAILSLLTGAPVRVGRQGTKNQFWHKIVYTKTLRDLKVAPPPVHPGSDQSLRVVRELGVDTANSTPMLYISQEDGRRAGALLAEAGIAPGTRFVTINPFSRWKYKEWNNAKWGEVIDLLWVAYRLPAVLIGSSEESAAGQEILAGREAHTINLAGKTTLGELAALLQLSSIHLGVDSAAPHIAAAVGRPTVTLFGPGNWQSWSVIDDLHRVVTADLPCVPCNRKGCDDSGQSRCLEQLTVPAVVKEIAAILEPK